MRSNEKLRISIVGYHGADLVDITGPFEVFATASSLAGEYGRPMPYTVELLSPDGGRIKTDSGLWLSADCSFDNFDGADTILIAGGVGKFGAISDNQTSAFLRAWSQHVRRIGSVCTGAFLLANAGLLNGRRAATHWRWCDKFEQMFPNTRVDRDAIFVEDGNVYTTAGVTAGIDLALALVEADFGRDLAMAVAREMVVFAKRPGGQSQFSVQLASQLSDRRPIQAIQTWISGNCEAELSVESLAARAGMSARNFSRVFKSEVGMTPRKYVESVRLERVRLLLEEGNLSLERIAFASGFSSTEVLRRNFQKRFGVAPADYAKRFGADHW